ncbi:hypothetical protein [Nonomuraea sp. NPDC050786]|uniref:hypothetical protein n=1 Tax=Nonomuraea sp. NPDC050786 TaxID=3154840 RepID=UPI0033E04A8F
MDMNVERLLERINGTNSMDVRRVLGVLIVQAPEALEKALNTVARWDAEGAGRVVPLAQKA